MTTLIPDIPIDFLNSLFFIVILNLIPLLIWSAWDLERRGLNWLSRRQCNSATRRQPFQT